MPGFDLGQNLIEPLGYLARIGFRQDAGFSQHLRVCLRAADVLRRQSLVETDRGIYLLHDLGRRHCKAATPHGVGGLVRHE